MSGDSEAQKQDAGTCGPGCACGSSRSSGRGRMVIGIAVLTVAGVLVVKAVRNDHGAATANAASADVAASPAISGPGTTTANPATAADTLKELDSLSDLNAVAADTAAVFVFIPGKDQAGAEAPMAQMRSAARTVEPQLRGGKVGMFALKAGSRDYEELTAQVAAPGVVAMVKGGGLSATSGDITETKLVQAFVAASRAGGCGAGGCGPQGCK